MSAPRDHRHSAGVVCVQLSAKDVTRLFEFADVDGMTQDEAIRHVVEWGLDDASEYVSHRKAQQ